MTKPFYRRWMFTYLLILALIGLGMIQVWLITSIPLDKTRARDITHVANESEPSLGEEGLATPLPPRSIREAGEKAIEKWLMDALVAVSADYRARPERMSVTGTGKDSLVTMMPPYSIRGPGEEPIEKEGMWLKDAVIAMCDLAGFEYNLNSNRAYRPLVHYLVRPAFEDVPWEEAMEQMLKPYNLTYTIEDNTVTIIRISGDAGIDALVTLKPPYAIWRKEVDPTDPKISIAGAAKAISNQAGYEFSWRRSERNTARLTSEWIHPDFEDITWEEAMEQILTPYNLTYTIEDNTVIITRPGQEHIAKNGLVSLKPPYNTWRDGEKITADTLRLSHAVNDICEQVGFEYIWKASADNTGALWKMQIQPVFENVTWEEGMKILLDPYDATYTVENYEVILAMKEGAEKPREETSIRRARMTINVSQRVSLKPPFTGWNPNKNDPQHVIAVIDAVNAVCRQAGISHDAQRSRKNTGPLCNRKISPHIDRMPWDAAIEDILAPVDLTYTIEANTVILKKKYQFKDKDVPYLE